MATTMLTNFKFQNPVSQEIFSIQIYVYLLITVFLIRKIKHNKEKKVEQSIPQDL